MRSSAPRVGVRSWKRGAVCLLRRGSVAWLLPLVLGAACGGEDVDASDPCAEVTCSDHGTCFAAGSSASCQCDEGFQPSGLACTEITVEPGIAAVEPAMVLLTQGDTVTVSVRLHAGVGNEDPADIQVLAPDGTLLAEVTDPSEPRLYDVDIGWDDMEALSPISFLESEERVLTVRATGEDGLLEERDLPVLLTCGGYGACEGECRLEIDMRVNDTPASCSCGLWECGGGTYPQACFSNPAAHLFVAKPDLDMLLEKPSEDLEAGGFFFMHGLCRPVTVEIQGGISVRFPKKSFKVKFDRSTWYPLDPFPAGPGETLPEDPVGFKQMVFKAQWIDGTLSRDRLTGDLLRGIGGLAPRVTYAHLVLNGGYYGLFALTEAVETDFFKRMGLHGDGNLYKAVNHNANFAKKDNVLAGYEKKANVAAASDDLEQLLAAIAAAPAGFVEFEALVGPLLDLDGYLRFVAANVFANNQDTFTKNYYLYHEADKPDLGFYIVNWDADATFGISWDGTDFPASQGTLWGKKNSLSSKLAKIPEYAAQYTGILWSLLEDPVAADASALLDAIVAHVGTDYRYEECRWSKPTGFEQEVVRIRAYLRERRGFLEEMLEDRDP